VPLALATIGLLLPSTALASASHEFEKAFGPDGTASSHFSVPGPVAVDEGTGDLYVADIGLGTVSKFDEGGTPVDFSAGPGSGTNDIGGFSLAEEEALNQIAVSPPAAPTVGNFYVASHGSGSIAAFEADGAEAEFSATSSNELSGFNFLCGVAVDTNGDIYAAVSSAGGSVTIFEPSGEEITSFAAPEACNLAVSPNGEIYVAPYVFSGIPVNGFTPSEFPITAATTYSPPVEIDPSRAYGVALDPSSGEVYVDEHSRIAQFEADGTPVGSFADEGSAGGVVKSEGLAVNGENERAYVSDTVGERQAGIFVPPPTNPPTVGAISFSSVTAASADLQALIDPELFKTRYHFEYLSEAEYQANGEAFAGAKSTAVSQLGQAGTPQPARTHLDGLVADTAYRFRASAENKNDEGSPVLSSEVGKFTTFSAFPVGLPDGRAYEMVSPTRKSGEVFPPEPNENLGSTCTECLPGINNQMMPMQSTADGESMAYEGQPFQGGLAAGPNEYLARRTAAGWNGGSLSSPLFSNRSGQGYKAFSADLGKSVVYQIEPALSAEAPSHEGVSFANLYLREGGGALRPLVAAEPPNRDPGGFEESFQIVYAGANAGSVATPALSHVVFEANDALTGDVPGVAPPAVDGGVATKQSFPANLNLYEWFEGTLRLVNVAPGNGETAPGAVIGSGRLLAEQPVYEAPDVDHAVSGDGSHIFWSKESSGQVFVRIDGTETVQIGDPGEFVTAAANGSKVLLSDGCLYSLETEGCEDLTLDEDKVPQGGFKGILGASEDLSRVYFIDNAVLTGAEENENGEVAETGKFNLYAWREGGTRFVGQLLGHDNQFGSNLRYGDWKASRPNRTAQVSADGRYLAFTSEAQLTSYNNAFGGEGECALNEGAACTEIYEYVAETEKLRCASCNPSGQRPQGPAYMSLIKGIPGFPPLPQPGNLSSEGEGRLFFVSQDVLSPYDTNGHIQDVYEWEPDGVGSCGREAGCDFLISSGQSANDSMFVNSTPSGKDAFFITRQQLLPGDRNEQLDLYDARAPHVIGESVGFPEVEVPPCGGEACKGPIAAPPILPSAGSAGFAGPGNPPKHKKSKHKKKAHHKKHKHKRTGK
jgi:hypothetical protein